VHLLLLLLLLLLCLLQPFLAHMRQHQSNGAQRAIRLRQV